jgi:hypothetical protein
MQTGVDSAPARLQFRRRLDDPQRRPYCAYYRSPGSGHGPEHTWAARNSQKLLRESKLKEEAAQPRGGFFIFPHFRYDAFLPNPLLALPQ